MFLSMGWFQVSGAGYSSMMATPTRVWLKPWWDVVFKISRPEGLDLVAELTGTIKEVLVLRFLVVNS